MYIVIIVCMLVWIYLLSVMHRAKLPFFKFLLGSVGMFIFMMIILQPIVTQPLSQLVAAATGVLGRASGIFTAYYQYAVVFINSGDSAISMYIDYECSGVIEIFAYVSLLWFFSLYSVFEKTVLSIMGVLWIFAANIVRLVVICLIVYFMGDSAYYFAHAIFGRIVFYSLSVILYFNVFTKAQVIRQKVGKFRYDRINESNS